MLGFIEANVAHSLESIHPPAEGALGGDSGRGADPREQAGPGRPRENQEERRVASAVGAQLSEDTLRWSHGLGRSPGPRESTPEAVKAPCLAQPPSFRCNSARAAGAGSHPFKVRSHPALLIW